VPSPLLLAARLCGSWHEEGDFSGTSGYCCAVDCSEAAVSFWAVAGTLWLLCTGDIVEAFGCSAEDPSAVFSIKCKAEMTGVLLNASLSSTSVCEDVCSLS